VWWRGGETWAPADPAMAAEMERAEADHAAAFAATFRPPIWAYLSPGWSRQPDEEPSSEQFAIVYLEWETAHPAEWRQDAGFSGSPYGLKESILQAIDLHGVSEPNRAAVERLLLAAVRGPYRAKDWRYARVAPPRRQRTVARSAGLDRGWRRPSCCTPRGLRAVSPRQPRPEHQPAAPTATGSSNVPRRDGRDRVADYGFRGRPRRCSPASQAQSSPTGATRSRCPRARSCRRECALLRARSRRARPAAPPWHWRTGAAAAPGSLRSMIGAACESTSGDAA